MLVVALLVALAAPVVASVLPPAAPETSRRWPWLTLAVAGGVLAGLLAQTTNPELLPRLAREPTLVTHGELWRAVTALFMQDAGVVGAAFNLICLLVVGAAAERRWRRSRWLIAYFGGGVLTEFLALAWQPSGAGNSVACFALAGALAAHAAAKPTPVQLALRALALSAGAALLLARDVHGVAFCLGVAIGAAFMATDRSRALSAPPA